MKTRTNSSLLIVTFFACTFILQNCYPTRNFVKVSETAIGVNPAKFERYLYSVQTCYKSLSGAKLATTPLGHRVMISWTAHGSISVYSIVEEPYKISEYFGSISPEGCEMSWKINGLSMNVQVDQNMVYKWIRDILEVSGYALCFATEEDEVVQP